MDTEQREPLWQFSYFDELRGRWLKARYRASVEEIQRRHKQYRLEGTPEVREPSGQFTPPTLKFERTP